MEESSGDDDSNIQDEIKNKYNKKKCSWCFIKFSVHLSTELNAYTSA